MATTNGDLCKTTGDFMLIHVGDVSPPPSDTSPTSSSSPLLPPDSVKWEVYTDKDKYGNKIWVEYPKDVTEILEYMYNHPLMSEDQTYVYKWTNLLSKKQTILFVSCQVV